MNVFVLSPGRTATTSLARAFSMVQGHTSAHESRVEHCGDARVDYPENHIECDNRLNWFLPRLTEKYGNSSVLVIVKREESEIARSYDKRWYKINIMKAYSQGVMLRDLSRNDLEVCSDYVRNVYEHLEFFRPFWKHCVTVSLDDPEPGLAEVVRLVDRTVDTDAVLNEFRDGRDNVSGVGVKLYLSIVKFALKNLVCDIQRNFPSSFRVPQ